MDYTNPWQRIIRYEPIEFFPIKGPLLTAPIHPFEENLGGLIEEVSYTSNVARYGIIAGMTIDRFEDLGKHALDDLVLKVTYP